MIFRHMATSVTSTLRVLGLSTTEQGPLRLHATLRAGLPARTIAALKARTGLADAELAEALQVSDRTLSRLRNAGAAKLSAELSDRVYAVASVYALAEEVFGERAAALQWMNDPQFGLEEKPPTVLLSTEPGRQQVRALLQRIEHGLLA
jgi:putative toxin-antitoxin system antitoxin component (TIGR02293 family)